MFGMINNEFITKFKIINIRVFCLIFTLIFCLTSINLHAQTHNKQKLYLYLPIGPDDLRQESDILQNDLKNNDFSHIEIQFAEYWHEYQQNIKNGRLGLYLAPPHFASWAINKHNFIPLMRVAEPLSFVIAAKKSQPEIFELNDLIDRTVCSQPPLNLDYLLSIEAFAKLLGSSNNKFIKHVDLEMQTQQSDCYGYIISNHIVRRFQLAGNDDYIRLYQGKTYNNYVLIAHPEINTKMLERFKHYLIQADTQKLLKPIFNLYANDTKLISSQKEDYPISYIGPLNLHWQQ